MLTSPFYEGVSYSRSSSSRLRLALYIIRANFLRMSVFASISSFFIVSICSNSRNASFSTYPSPSLSAAERGFPPSCVRRILINEARRDTSILECSIFVQTFEKIGIRFSGVPDVTITVAVRLTRIIS